MGDHLTGSDNQMPDLVFWTYDLGDRSQFLVVKTLFWNVMPSWDQSQC